MRKSAIFGIMLAGVLPAQHALTQQPAPSKKPTAPALAFVALPKDIQCSLQGVSFMSVVGAHGQMENTNGEVGSVSCWIVTKGEDRKKKIPLASNEITHDIIETKDFGRLKMTPENSITSAGSSLSIRTDKIKSLRAFLLESVDPREAEDAEWKSATEKDTPAAYWEFNRKFPNSNRVRVEHGRIATTVAYINAGNGMEAYASIAVGDEKFPISENQMQQWRFVRYEHVGDFLAPETGGSIENGTAILVKEDDSTYKIVDVQGTVDGGGTDPFKPSLQLNGNAIRSGGLQWQLEASAKTLTWDEARTYCSGLSDGGGVWRLPTEQELLALYSAKYSILNGNKEYEIITSLGTGRYWSSSVGTEIADYAQEVNFDDGSTHEDVTGYAYLVRCVK